MSAFTAGSAHLIEKLAKMAFMKKEQYRGLLSSNLCF